MLRPRRMRVNTAAAETVGTAAAAEAKAATARVKIENTEIREHPALVRTGRGAATAASLCITDRRYIWQITIQSIPVRRSTPL